MELSQFFLIIVGAQDCVLWLKSVVNPISDRSGLQLNPIFLIFFISVIVWKEGRPDSQVFQAVSAFYKIDKQQPAGSHGSQDPILYVSFSSIIASDEGPLAPYMACPLSRGIFVASYRLLVFYIPCILFQLNCCSQIWASLCVRVGPNISPVHGRVSGWLSWTLFTKIF